MEDRFGSSDSFLVLRACPSKPGSYIRTVVVHTLDVKAVVGEPSSRTGNEFRGSVECLQDPIGPGELR
jgi:hypothetical protein